MYAVIKTGGHQYKVEKGSIFEFEKIDGKVGDTVTFDQVLCFHDGVSAQFGAPIVSGAKVEGVIKAQKRAPKVLIFKYKRRKNHKKLRGHKQPLSVVEIQNLTA
jgi:large subunit ribosomal protein L21